MFDLKNIEDKNQCLRLNEKVMQNYGKRLRPDVREGQGIRDEFIRLIVEGEVAPWRGALILRRVCLDPRGVGDFSAAPDLVLLHPERGLGIVECKKASSGQAKHGMFEQVLMYGEMVRCLNRSELLAHLKAGVPIGRDKSTHIDTIL